MSSIANINLKVVLFDTDFYALQSLNSYLAWDRRTRVMFYSETLDALWAYLNKVSQAELPDIVIMDVDHIGGRDALIKTIERLNARIEKLRIICLTQQIDTNIIETAAEHNVTAYLSKNEVRLQIAAAVVYSLNHDFVITKDIARATSKIFNNRLFHATVLPDRRDIPELTERIRQAIQLCVVEGMPANLAADEMGISLHTIRSYIKEGYRILENSDDDSTEYPVDMTPQERAFMRFTALKEDKSDKDTGSPSRSEG